MTRDEAVKMLQATRLMLTDGANQPISDLYYALDMAIEALEQTEPTSSEKPNNCEHITEDGVTCAKYPACDDCLDNPLNKVKGSERLVKGSEQTEPTISKMEQVETEPQTFDKPTKCLGCVYSDLDKDFHPCASCENFSKYVGEVSGKDEPQTDCAWK